MPDQKLIEKNKTRLIEEKQRLEKLLMKMGPEYEELGSTEDDNAAEVEIFERNLAEERDLKAQLGKVAAALARIENGAYGICAAGGEEIPAERLIAAPEAETCVEHAK